MKVQRAYQVLLLVILGGGGLGTTASAQEVANIVGTVQDASGAILPGVTVEVESPALIERVRTAVTDGQGQYRVAELRPGVYSVTFALPGFSTYKRDGLELSAGFTATVNANLRLGAVEETITVTGATPVVDTQSARTQTVMTRAALDALPYARTFASYTNMVPGITGGVATSAGTPTRDVGGTLGEVPLGLRAHGSDPGLTSVDGVKTLSMAGADWRRLNTSDLYTQEVILEVGNGSAEAWSGGVNANVIMKDGGNQLHGVGSAVYTGKGFDSNNLSDELRGRGLDRYNKQHYLYDIGMGIGGPIARDKAWFFFSPRRWGNKYEVPGVFFNKTPNTLFYSPDTDRPGLARRLNWDVSGKVTWQAAEKHKISIANLNSYQCFCPYNLDSGVIDPAAAFVFLYHPQRLLNVGWTYPATSHVLIEANVAYRNEGSSANRPDPEIANASARPITDLGLNLTYGANGSYYDNPSEHWETRASVSYITGAHQFKAGATTVTAYQGFLFHPNTTETYTFRNQVPLALTQFAWPDYQKNDLDLGLGLFAQDQWRLNRLSLNLGLRFDYVHATSPALTRPAGFYLPEIQIPEVKNVPNWKDINPRLGAVYDIFGTGKTAVKVSLGRYELGNNYSLVFTKNNSVSSTLVTAAGRTWNDANMNYVPDCELRSVGANGECGALSNQAFGTSVVRTTYADDVKEGWGVSPYLWQAAASVQHELMPNVGLTVGYYRTSIRNIYTTDNTLVSASDFSSYCITAPTDARLPGGGGYQVCGLYDVNPSKFGQVQNLVAQSSDYGGATRVFNGVDILLNGRFGQGGLLNGGLSTGSTHTDICNITDVPGQFCDDTSPWLAGTELKLNAVYPLPVWGLQVSGTYQNLPGRDRGSSAGNSASFTSLFSPLAVNYIATNAEIAPSLGRNLSACPTSTGPCNATATVGIVGPGVMFEPRANQFDMRFSKVMRFGGRRLQANLDIYNLTNAADVLTLNTIYGPTFLNVRNVLTGRLVKIGAQFDF